MLGRMCQHNPDLRIQSFSDIDKEIQSELFFEIGFSKEEMDCYHNFADSLDSHIRKIENEAKYQDDVERVQTALENAYRSFMLEENVPDSAAVISCFIIGAYYYKKKEFSVNIVRDFLHLLKSSSLVKKRIILSNLQTRLDSISRYSEQEENDLPF